MFYLIVDLIATLIVTAGPEIAIVRAGIIPVVTGLCAGKVVAGIFKEVLSWLTGPMKARHHFFVLYCIS
ncbi:MAG: hypothetical protein JSW07_05090 [bacterium]|nr:MAG: hypothetical protein JSW07_05090 [bacterium]